MIGEERTARGGGRPSDKPRNGQDENQDKGQKTDGPAMPLVTVSSMILMSNHMDQCSI